MLIHYYRRGKYRCIGDAAAESAAGSGAGDAAGDAAGSAAESGAGAAAESGAEDAAGDAAGSAAETSGPGRKISAASKGEEHTAAEPPAASPGAAMAAGQLPVRPTFRTWVDTAGPLQKQLLLDYEEDRLCVVRQVSRYGSIGGRRLWPSAEPENTDQRDSDECA